MTEDDPAQRRPAPPYPPPGTHHQPQRTNGLAVTAMVLGIVGLFLPLVSVLAIVFGGVGLKKARELQGSGKGMAIAGLVLGIVAVAFWALWLLLVVSVSSTTTL